MEKNLNLESDKNFDDILEGDLPLEECVAKLLSRLKNQNFRPSLNELFNMLKKEENWLISSYNSISEAIKLKISNFLDEINDLRSKNLKIELEMSGMQSNFRKYQDIYEKVSISAEEKKSNEYMKFLKIYETMSELSNKVLDKKQQIEKLLNLQKILDSSFALEIIDLEYLIGKLNLLINNFGSFKTQGLLKAYILKFSRKIDLEKLILDKESKFEEMKLLAKDNIEKGFAFLDRSNSFESDLISSSKSSRKITKDLFISEK